MDRGKVVKKTSITFSTAAISCALFKALLKRLSCKILKLLQFGRGG